MNLTLRRASVDDAPAFARIMGDPRVYPNLLQLPFADVALWRERLAARTAEHPGLLLVAERNGEVVGNAGLDPLGTSLRRRHAMGIGMAVAPDAWGQGVGSALLAALCEQADRWLQVWRLTLTVYADNARAIALYRRFGFEHEGRHRCYALRDGMYIDALAMARLNPQRPAFPRAATSAALADAGGARVPAASSVASVAAGPVEIRPAEPADDVAIAAVLRQRGVVENLLQSSWSSLDAVSRMLAQRTEPLCDVVASIDGRIVGNAAVSVQASARRRHVGVLAIFVAAEAQGRGVGDALMRSVLEWSDRWAGLLRVELGVNADNAAAIALYRKHGFELEATERSHSLRDGAYVDGLFMARLHPRPPA